tara:strand:- start:4723 stop:4962 length:240 start_codon:yes stop_codon:yes gene_type:complete
LLDEAIDAIEVTRYQISRISGNLHTKHAAHWSASGLLKKSSTSLTNETSGFGLVDPCGSTLGMVSRVSGSRVLPSEVTP